MWEVPGRQLAGVRVAVLGWDSGGGCARILGKGGNLLRECGGRARLLFTRKTLQLDLIGCGLPYTGRHTRACGPGKRSAGGNRHISRRRHGAMSIQRLCRRMRLLWRVLQMCPTASSGGHGIRWRTRRNGMRTGRRVLSSSLSTARLGLVWSRSRSPRLKQRQPLPTGN